MAVRPIPEGFRSITPSSAVVGCAEAIALYEHVFGAEVKSRFDLPGGTVGHCELRFGDSLVMMGEAGGDMKPYGMHLMLYVPDCDAVFAKARAAGFEVSQEPTNQFWGDRMARVKDRFGNEWFIGTHVEDVSDEEVRRRMAKMAAG